MTDFNLETEIKANLEKFGKVTTDAMEIAKKNRSDLEEGFKKAADESATLLEKVNGLLNEKKEHFKKIELLEKALNRPAVSGTPRVSESTLKYNMGIEEYLKAGSFLDEKLVKDMHKQFIKQGDLKGDRWLTKDMIESINPSGGFWILPERKEEEVTKLWETSPIRQVATVLQTTSKEATFIINDNQAVSGGWVGEITSRPTTATPAIGELTIPVYEQYSNPRVSQRLLDDTPFDLQSWLVGLVQDRMTRDENTAFVVGDGANKPEGFLTLPAWGKVVYQIGNDENYTRGALEYIGTEANNVIDYDSLVNVQNSLLSGYQGNAIWMMHRTTWGAILKIKSTTEFPLISPAFGMKEGFDQLLLGKRVVFADDIPKLLAAGGSGQQAAMVYGDFKLGYTILDRMGYRVLRDQFTQKPYIQFYTTKRVGGATTNYQSLKVLQATTPT